MNGEGSVAGGRLRSILALVAVLLAGPFVLLFDAAKVRAADPQSAAAHPSSAPPTEPPKIASPSTAPTEHCVRRFLAPMEAMEGRVALEPSMDTSRAADDWLRRVRAAASRLRTAYASDGANPAAVSSMIVTLPDPVDSGLGYSFETMLQAVRLGIERPLAEEAFFRDRAWLPWSDRQGDPKLDRQSEDCRLSMPGIVLFRGKKEGAPNVLAVLVVGESATTGLRRATMHRALQIASEIAAAENSESRRTVRIVGPTFSGSAWSLALALRTWASQAPGVSFRVRSGTASGADVPEQLNGATAGALPNGSDLSYQATTLPEAAIECAYLWFLNKQFGVEPVDEEAEEQETKLLEGVATLSESGTEFGATAGADVGAKASNQPGTPGTSSIGRCRWAASSAFRFPYHIASLRDAYEDLDDREEASRQEAPVARATSLDVSLREARSPLDLEPIPGPKTKAAQDVMLSNLLGQISARSIRHLAIHATSMGDAIFLARKIRDVAPDVRLAFFDTDSMLEHPAYQRDLAGSLVVSPYPFLGVAPFASSFANGAEQFGGFENASSQGLYNAVLSQRTEDPGLLSNYAFSSKCVLPVWISAIGRGSLVPLRVRPNPDCADTVFGSRTPQAEAWCKAAGGADGGVRWQEFVKDSLPTLQLASDLTLPRAWDLLFVILLFAFYFDDRRQTKLASRLATDPFTANFTGTDDRTLDRAIGRTKWLLYSAIRRFVFSLAFAFMSAFYTLSSLAGGGPSRHVLMTLASVGALLISLERTWRGGQRFLGDYSAFGRWLGESLIPRSVEHWAEGLTPSDRSPGRDRPARRRTVINKKRTTRLARLSAPPSSRSRLLDRFSLGLGFLKPMERLEVARTSFGQIRLLVVMTTVLAASFTFLLAIDTVRTVEWYGWNFNLATPALTLTVLRHTPLTNGVSPPTPAFLCMLCVYGWAAARMGRLSLAHSTSRVSPLDGETDLVSTPMRLILHPSYGTKGTSDDGFTGVERDVADSIWRPITGRYYASLCVGLGVFPVVLFTLKPLSTLEGTYGTLLLGGALGLSVFLIAVTMVQLVQWWLALERLLKRTMEHPIAAAFRKIPAFARDSVDQLVSRAPHELLRWGACAQQLSDLEASAATLSDFELLSDHRAWLAVDAKRLRAIRSGALGGVRDTRAKVPRIREARVRRVERTERLEYTLVRTVILATSSISAVLERAWNGHESAARARAEANTARAPLAIAVAVGASWFPALSPGVAACTPPMAKGLPSSHPPSGTRATAPEPGKSEPGVERGPDGGDALDPVSHRFSVEELRWLRSAQVFVATVVTLLIHRHIRQFRYFVSMTTGCALLLLVAVTSYPFEPHRLILTFTWVVIASVVATNLWVFIQMDRNTLMSHVSGTNPNHVTWNGAFALRVLTWGVVPLLGAAAAQYPQLARVIFDFVSPFVRALR